MHEPYSAGLTVPGDALQPEETVGYRGVTACHAVGISYRQIDYWARTGLVTPSVRGQVPIPAGSTQIFDGCYKVANSSCIDAFLPPSGNKVIKCVDDITSLLHSVAPSRGPVISSMEAFTPTLVPTPVMEPINWCVEEPVECVAGACSP